MKKIIRNILFALLLPTLAMADTETSCLSNSDNSGCESYKGCEISGLDTKTCKGCYNGTYNDGTTGDVTQCKPCANKIPDDAEQTDFTTPNCPWELTCPAGTYYDTTANECAQCSGNQYASGDSPIFFNGTEIQGRKECTKCPEHSQPNPEHNDWVCDAGYNKSSNGCIKNCTKNQYRDGDQCIDCPTGSTTSGNNATAITDCYMTQGETQFCDGSGVLCIDFNTVFGSGQINYDKNN